MYLRTEDNETLEMKEQDEPYVNPKSEPTEWELRLEIEDDEDDEDEETIIIATFKTVKEANSALSALRVAIELDQGWDAIEFKKRLESGTSQ